MGKVAEKIGTGVEKTQELIHYVQNARLFSCFDREPRTQREDQPSQMNINDQGSDRHSEPEFVDVTPQ